MAEVVRGALGGLRIGFVTKLFCCDLLHNLWTWLFSYIYLKQKKTSFFQFQTTVVFCLVTASFCPYFDNFWCAQHREAKTIFLLQIRKHAAPSCPMCSCLWNNLLENMFMSWTGVLFGRGEAINLILLLKETNGILSIIPDLGRIYNLFAPKSTESKSCLNFSNMCFLRSKNMKAILGVVLAVPPLGLELFTLPSY